MIPFSDLAGDYYSMEHSREREIIVRHVPGLEPVLRLLWHHASERFMASAECGGGYCRDGVDHL
jgi:hypothetical protein